jgi:hypothetical protein
MCSLCALHRLFLRLSCLSVSRYLLHCSHPTHPISIVQLLTTNAMLGALAVLNSRNTKTLMHLREEQQSRSLPAPPIPPKKAHFWLSGRDGNANTKTILHMNKCLGISTLPCSHWRQGGPQGPAGPPSGSFQTCLYRDLLSFCSFRCVTTGSA